MKHHWNRALVTGASAGIGQALARLLAAEHTDLVLVARDGDRLSALADELDVDVEVLPADLTDPAGLALVEARLLDQRRPVDLLVNNAGSGVPGAVVGSDADQLRTMLALNVEAVVVLSRAAAAAMTPRSRGGILNVSSLAGDLPAPGAAVYGATKAFVTSFSESLAIELAGSGVVVTCLRPGLTHTEFHQRADDTETTQLPELLWQEADQVAEVGLRAVSEGRTTVVSGLHNRVAATAAKVAPGALVRAVAGRSNPRNPAT